MGLIANSKTGKCDRCGSDGLCRKRKKDLVCLACCKIEDVAKQTAKANLKQRVRSIGNKLIQEGNYSDNKKFNDLQQWFSDRKRDIAKNSRCWECGAYIPNPYYRHASAHIFPKSIFVSISTHPLNFLVLGASCGCHSKFDSSVETASKMKVWTEACRRFEKFEEFITENHKYYDLFKQYYVP